MSHTSYVAAIDGGGTKTECVIVDHTGRCVAKGLGGPSNIRYTEKSVVIESFTTAIDSALACSDEPVQVNVVGCTHRVAELPEIADLVYGRLRGEIRRYSEGEAALGSAGVFERYGVAQIAGTGSSTYGFPRDGSPMLVGGWGAVLGDEGSAYDIALNGLRAAVRSIDGRAPDTKLLHLALNHFDLGSEREEYLRVAETSDRSTIASFAEMVTHAAEAGDDLAAAIVAHAAEELSHAIKTVASVLFDTEEAFPVVFHGGVFQSPDIVRQVSSSVETSYPNATIWLPVHSPGMGLALFLQHELTKENVP